MHFKYLPDADLDPYMLLESNENLMDDAGIAIPKSYMMMGKFGEVKGWRMTREQRSNTLWDYHLRHGA
ncbi:hypothetical protein AA102526_0838 [Asaia lannensis NBRC 102526]|nr:hypothetical protein AA102526_0838 [Asaia lannensis NBRC 102526]